MNYNSSNSRADLCSLWLTGLRSQSESECVTPGPWLCYKERPHSTVIMDTDFDETYVLLLADSNLPTAWAHSSHPLGSSPMECMDSSGRAATAGTVAFIQDSLRHTYFLVGPRLRDDPESGPSITSTSGLKKLECTTHQPRGSPLIEEEARAHSPTASW
jgi:hypothetical protein